MYETRMLPHETEQILVSILLTNLTLNTIKELDFSMCDTPMVTLVRAVSIFSSVRGLVFKKICNNIEIMYKKCSNMENWKRNKKQGKGLQKLQLS